MKEVIRIFEEEENKHVEFQYIFSGPQGWIEADYDPSDYKKVVYLGKCSTDGDMFAAYGRGGRIEIFKGQLNRGKY